MASKLSETSLWVLREVVTAGRWLKAHRDEYPQTTVKALARRGLVTTREQHLTSHSRRTGPHLWTFLEFKATEAGIALVGEVLAKEAAKVAPPKP